MGNDKEIPQRPPTQTDRLNWISSLLEVIRVLVAENARLMSEIERSVPIHKHDHEYFHDDCALCHWEKEDYEARQKRLKGE